MTSQARFAKPAGWRTCLVAACAITLTACSHPAAPPAKNPGATVVPALAPGARLGYVRMDVLVRSHPLAPQLARLDEDIDALRLSAAGAETARASADIVRERDRLTHDLEVATKHARTILARERAEEERRERAAIATALAASDAANGRSGTEIVASIRETYARQARDVARAQAENIASFRGQTIAQETEAERSLARALQDRAMRILRARADRLQQAEAAEALRLASADAPERLQIRTRLMNLALTESERTAQQNRLAALDRAEGDTLGARRNRDAQTLADLRTSTTASMRAEYGRDIAALRAGTVKKLGLRAAEMPSALAAIPPLDPGKPTSARATTLSPDLRATIERLHTRFAADFARDAERTVRELTATRTDLARRFTRLHLADVQARASAETEMKRLRAQRAELSAEIVDQITRETQTTARERGVRLVLGGIVAAARGVDLTSDVEKSIEKLHQ